MIPERVDFELDSVQRVEPGDVTIRVEGVESEECRAAIRWKVAQILRQPGSIATDAATRPDSEEPRPLSDAFQLGLTGPFADPHRQGQLHDAVHAAVAAELSSAEPAPQLASAAACVCASGTPGDRLGLSPPFPWWDSAGVFVPPPGGGTWVGAVKLDHAGWNWARLVVSDGAAATPPIPKDQMVVGLANGTSWAKEIWFQNLCSGRFGAVFQGGTSTTFSRARLTSPDCWTGTDTIVFRKPGFWGIWHDVGHFPPLRFWEAFGGTVADFTWVID